MANIYHRKFYLDQQQTRMAPLTTFNSVSYSKYPMFYAEVEKSKIKANLA